MGSTREKTECYNMYPKYEIYSAGKLMLFRIFATSLSAIIMWYSSDYSKLFFNTLAVFSISQLLYVFSIKCRDSIRQIFSYVALMIILCITFIAITGLMGITDIVSTDVGYMIAFAKSGDVLYLFRSSMFILITTVLLIFIYVIEWGTSWYSELADHPQIKDVIENEKGCD